MTWRDPAEPERWVVSTDAPPELRALLEVARREGPSIAQKASLGSRLGLSTGQALLGLSAKGVVLGAVVLAAATGAAFGVYTTQAEVPALSAPASADHRAVPDPTSASEPTKDASAIAVTAAPRDELPKEHAPEPATTHQGKRPSEASLIRGARDALSTSPRQARSLLDRHRRLYPEGRLAEEREVLLIEVLELEGREAEASARAAEFRQKNPDSAHRPSAP